MATKPRAWGAPVEAAAPRSFADIMSEQLVEDFMRPSRAAEVVCSTDDLPDVAGVSGVTDDGCVDDYTLARLLQLECDREHNEMLRREEAQYNKNNKVSISFDRYRVNSAGGFDDEDSTDSDSETREYLNDRLDRRNAPNFGNSGVVKQGDQLVTKHDKVLSGRANANRVMNFPPGFCTGDGAGMDMQLPNHVFNKLKTHSLNENKRAARLHEKKEQSTAEFAVDATTRLMMFKLVDGGLLDSITGSISTGKEANVFHAYGGRLEAMEIPSECALKVYKTTLSEFKNRKEYVNSDFRFKNPRKVLKIWAEKEMLNLNRMARFGILCPRVVKLRKHILVMSFIGRDAKAAPKLKDAVLSAEEVAAAGDQIIKAMKCMFEKARLVHADLSEFNILWHDGKAYLIDVSQTVDVSHVKALWFLARDCENVCRHFAKRGAEFPCALDLFNQITDLGIKLDDDEDFLVKIEEYSNEQPDMTQILADKKRPADFERRNADQLLDEC